MVKITRFLKFLKFYLNKPATDAACIEMRFNMIKHEIAACYTYAKVKACEDAIKLFLEAPYGDKAFHEVQKLKQMAAKKASSITRRNLAYQFADEVIALALKHTA